MAKKTKNKRKLLEKQLDLAFSEFVRLRADGKCDMCGRKGGKLDAHHLFKRSRRSVRWDTLNGVALCFRCHRLGAHSPDFGDQANFHKWCVDTYGTTMLDRLEAESHQIVKMSIPDLEEKLDQLKCLTKMYRKV